MTSDNQNNNYYSEYGHDIDESSRGLTFLAVDDDTYFLEYVTSPLAWMIGLSVLSVLFTIMAVWKWRMATSCRQFYEWNALRLILPFSHVCLALECATLAVDVAPNQAIPVARQWAIAVYMLEATIAPSIFLSTFVLVFLSYRNRCLPFCLVHRGKSQHNVASVGSGGMVMVGALARPSIAPASTSTAPNLDDMDDEGRPDMFDEESGGAQPLVRPASLIVMIRVFSLFLFTLALVVNFDVVWTTSDLAGRTGWTTVVTAPWNPEMEHIVMALVPMALVCFCCLYFSLLLWRYGSLFSMKIYPSMWNPWMIPFLGTVCMMVGQCLGPSTFPWGSNVGILLYQLCFLRCMYEVRYDIKHTRDLGDFLEALGDDGVTRAVLPPGGTTPRMTAMAPSSFASR